MHADLTVIIVTYGDQDRFTWAADQAAEFSRDIRSYRGHAALELPVSDTVTVHPEVGANGLASTLRGARSMVLHIHDDVCITEDALLQMIQTHTETGKLVTPSTNDPETSHAFSALPPAMYARPKLLRTRSEVTDPKVAEDVVPCCLLGDASQITGLIPFRPAFPGSTVRSVAGDIVVAPHALASHDNAESSFAHLVAATHDVVIAASMIVRDEEDMLPACLDSLVGLIDRIDVADTGSDDGTLQILADRGIVPIHREWREDFGWARNEVIDAFPEAVWLLQVDADETVHIDDPERLRRQLRAATADFDSFEIRMDDASDAAGSRSSWLSRRLFRPDTMHFEGALHEQPVRRDGSGFGRRGMLHGIRLTHFGYTNELIQSRGKQERNLRISKQAWEEHRDLHTTLQYARSHELAGLPAEERVLLYEEVRDEMGVPEARHAAYILGMLATTVLRCAEPDHAKARTYAGEGLELVPHDQLALGAHLRASLDLGEPDQVLATLRWSRSQASLEPLYDDDELRAKVLSFESEALEAVGDLESAHDVMAQSLAGGLESSAGWRRLGRLDDVLGRTAGVDAVLASGSMMGLQQMLGLLEPAAASDLALSAVEHHPDAAVATVAIRAAIVSRDAARVVRAIDGAGSLVDPAFLVEVTAQARELGLLPRDAETAPIRHILTLIRDTMGDPAIIARTIESLAAQDVGGDVLVSHAVVPADASIADLKRRLAVSGADAVIVPHAGASFRPNAIRRYRAALDATPDAAVCSGTWLVEVGEELLATMPRLVAADGVVRGPEVLNVMASRWEHVIGGLDSAMVRRDVFLAADVDDDIGWSDASVLLSALVGHDLFVLGDVVLTIPAGALHRQGAEVDWNAYARALRARDLPPPHMGMLLPQIPSTRPWWSDEVRTGLLALLRSPRPTTEAVDQVTALDPADMSIPFTAAMILSSRQDSESLTKVLLERLSTGDHPYPPAMIELVGLLEDDAAKDALSRSVMAMVPNDRMIGDNVSELGSDVLRPAIGSGDPAILRGPNVVDDPVGVPGLTSIVIVTYNSSSTIEQCLAAIDEDENCEILVVDNCSADDSRAVVRRLAWSDSRIRLLEPDRNLGFAAGCNHGMLRARGDAVLLLNPDAILSPRTLPRLRASLSDEVWATGPLSNYVAGSQNISAYLNPAKHEALTRGTADDELSQVFDAYFVEQHGTQVIDVSILIGFCLLISRAALHELGGLDPELFFGNDDLDLSWRITEIGKRLAITAGCFVHHIGHVSARSVGADARNQLIRDSTEHLARKLDHYYGTPRPSGRAIWGIPWFTEQANAGEEPAAQAA